jgi:hypothetical protein
MGLSLIRRDPEKKTRNSVAVAAYSPAAEIAHRLGPDPPPINGETHHE